MRDEQAHWKLAKDGVTPSGQTGADLAAAAPDVQARIDEGSPHAEPYDVPPDPEPQVAPDVQARGMTAELLPDSVEYGTERPCRVGRITYTEGVRRYVALAFTHLDEPEAWRLTWVGEEGEDAVRLPAGILPSEEMLAALGARHVTPAPDVQARDQAAQLQDAIGQYVNDPAMHKIVRATDHGWIEIQADVLAALLTHTQTLTDRADDLEIRMDAEIVAHGETEERAEAAEAEVARLRTERANETMVDAREITGLRERVATLETALRRATAHNDAAADRAALDQDDPA